MKLGQSHVKSRKVLRKESRKAKKQRKHEYYMRRGKHKNKKEASYENKVKNKKEVPRQNLPKPQVREKVKLNQGNEFRSLQERQDYEIRKEKKQRQILDNQIKKKRIERLIQDNLAEDKEITKLEKQLKFRKGKRTGAFALDGLDDILDFCEKKISKTDGERTFHESDTDFESDLATVMGKERNQPSRKEKRKRDDSDGGSDILSDNSDVDYESEVESDGDSDGFFTRGSKEKPIKPKGKMKKISVTSNSDSDIESSDSDIVNSKISSKKAVRFANEDDSIKESDDEEAFDDGDSFSDELSDENGGKPPRKKLKVENKNKKIKVPTKVKDISKDKEEKSSLKKKTKEKGNVSKKNRKGTSKENKNNNDDDNEADDSGEGNIFDNASGTDDENGEENGVKDSEIWEDIYGRARDREGNVIKAYKPPHLRKIITNETNDNNKEKLLRLKKQLKGLLNRLAEKNMASVSSQIEALYMSNSRNEMNETLYALISEAIISEVLTPERLIAEHAMLIAILHANIGSEVGAFFLQFSVTQFDKMLKEELLIENKCINNLMLFIMHLYNFQLFHSKLIYDLIYELLKNLQEKQIELLLLTLRTVGFSLRKDDPMALKALVLKIQEQANSISNNEETYSRMKFMLETVSAIKNNNVSKIPNYDPELVEHLKKCLKVLIRKGNHKVELNICLQDLLNAEEHGRWWVVGSAWSGAIPNENNTAADSTESALSKPSFSQKLLDLAKKQRMNTDVRRTVFCTLMSAEDYLDAFEKLLKLGLKGTVERELMNVLLHCAMQEKEFNPYYFHLANKFCICDRKYQIMIQYALWDRIKELNNLTPIQVTNLAKFLGNIIVAKGLPISVLKVIQFSELDKTAVKFIRQVLLTILLSDGETVSSVFSRIVNSSKLKIFRDGIRLFLHHFLLKNIKNNPDDNSSHLLKMIEVADKSLTSSDLRLIF